MLPPFWFSPLLVAVLVTMLALYGLTVAGHFPAERRANDLRAGAGIFILWATILVAALSAAAGVAFAARALSWPPAVIATGLGLLVAPLVLQRLPNSVVDGRAGLVLFAALAAVLAGGAHLLPV